MFSLYTPLFCVKRRDYTPTAITQALQCIHTLYTPLIYPYITLKQSDTNYKIVTYTYNQMYNKIINPIIIKYNQSCSLNHSLSTHTSGLKGDYLNNNTLSAIIKITKMKKYISLLKYFFRSNLTQNHENAVELRTSSWFFGFPFAFWKHTDIVHIYIYMNVYNINLHKLYQIISPTSLYTSSLNKISCAYTLITMIYTILYQHIYNITPQTTKKQIDICSYNYNNTYKHNITIIKYIINNLHIKEHTINLFITHTHIYYTIIVYKYKNDNHYNNNNYNNSNIDYSHNHNYSNNNNNNKYNNNNKNSDNNSNCRNNNKYKNNKYNYNNNNNYNYYNYNSNTTINTNYINKNKNNTINYNNNYINCNIKNTYCILHREQQKIIINNNKNTKHFTKYITIYYIKHNILITKRYKKRKRKIILTQTKFNIIGKRVISMYTHILYCLINIICFLCYSVNKNVVQKEGKQSVV